MNEELIKRIDERIAYWNEGLPSTGPTVELLQDCRVGLLAQSAENESLRNQNTALDEKLAEISEKKYMPLKPLEWAEQMPGLKEADLYKVIMAESVVIRRAGLEVAND